MEEKLSALLTSADYASSRETLQRMIGKRVQRLWILQSKTNGVPDAGEAQPALEIAEPGIGIEFASEGHCTVGIRADNAIVAEPHPLTDGNDPNFTARDISDWHCCLPFVSTSLTSVDALVDLDEYPQGIIGGLRLSFSDDQVLVVDYRRFRGPSESYLEYRLRFGDDETIATWWRVVRWIPG